jgi:hypothetical protein
MASARQQPKIPKNALGIQLPDFGPNKQLETQDIVMITYEQYILALFTYSNVPAEPSVKVPIELIDQALPILQVGNQEIRVLLGRDVIETKEDQAFVNFVHSPSWLRSILGKKYTCQIEQHVAS